MNVKTNTIKKILIALDYDPTASKVAEFGFFIAESMHAEVILLNVITDKTYYSALDYSPMPDIMGFNGMDAAVLFKTDGVKEAMNNFLEKTKLHLGGKDIKTQVEEGDCAETILLTAEKFNADVIVLGSHSKKWLENIIMGSVSEKVLNHTTIPLLIIPTKKPK